MKEPALNGYLRDFLVSNTVSLIIAFLLYGTGTDFFSAFLLSLLFVSAILLIFGGAIGFLLSGVSFKMLQRILNRRGKKPDENEDTSKEDYSSNDQLRTGKRLAIVGFVTLAESIIIALI